MTSERAYLLLKRLISSIIGTQSWAHGLFEPSGTKRETRPSIDLQYQRLLRLFKIPSLVFGAAILLWGSQPWKNEDPARWSPQDVERITTDSPWAQAAGASFALAAELEPPPPPPPTPGAEAAGMAGPRGVTDGRWDGGVGRADRNGPPALNVTVRWDSALPVVLALSREPDRSNLREQAKKDYIVTVIGLVPGGRYGRSGFSPSSSDSARDVRNPEEMLEAVMQYSRLLLKGKPAIAPVDAKLDPASGALHLFFPRTQPINVRDKDVVFETRFGSLSVSKKFRLKDMVFRGQLAL